ncbi:MAG: sulfatase-like hydrolase/transferase [Actinomycetota bacterium]|nr:sulfatase-like hydrolase/transferase [Actinomycetota bacterium]
MIFILTDDMRKDDLAYMPKTRSLLEGRGTSFENAFVSHALCAPSRATIMRGQYAHNTHVSSNSSTDSRLGLPERKHWQDGAERVEIELPG